MKISDEMVKAALSTWYRQTSMESAEHAMRAALSAAAPLIIEECAKVAETTEVIVASRSASMTYTATCATIARNIRALVGE